jgi:hypothetical protein
MSPSIATIAYKNKGKLYGILFNLSFATGVFDNPPRLINTSPVSKGLHYKGV